MKPALVLLALAAGIASAQDYKMEPAGAPPSDLAPAIASALSQQGYKISAANGSVYCEIWFRSALPAGPKSSEDNVAFPTIPQGALIAAIRFPAQAADRRGQQIKAGTYTLRYSDFPVNGDHLGVSPQRDFLLMSPAADDKDPNSTPNFDDLVKMSTKVSGSPHPAVLVLEPPAGPNTPAFAKEGEHDWSLAVKVGSTPLAVILIGKAEG